MQIIRNMLLLCAVSLSLYAAPVSRYVDVDEAEKEVEYLEDLRERGTQNLTYFEGEIQRLEIQRLEAVQTLQKMQTALRTIQDNLSKLHRKKVRTEDNYEIAVLDESIRRVNSMKETAEADVVKIEERIALLEEKLKYAEDQKLIAEAQIRKADDRLPELKAAIRRTRAEQEAVEKRLKEAQAAVLEVMDTLDELDEEEDQ